jgi:hypothetical protein
VSTSPDPASWTAWDPRQVFSSEVHSHRLHRRGDGFGTGPGPFAARLHGDLTRYREFQEGMARMTAWMRRLDADCARLREFRRAFQGRPR